MAIKKIDNGIYEMEKEEKMKVSAYIFANEKLMEQIKKDRTFWQLKNVASLEGVVKHALLMPDGHEGYGFPIGGVAAFDGETGVVSPGGIGYDINCLPGDSKIIDEFGAVRRISDFDDQNILENKDGTILIGLNTTKLKSLSSVHLTSSSAPYFMRKNEKNGLQKITTNIGFEIRSTPDHPILTREGMKLAKELKQNDGVGVIFYEGVNHESLSNKILFSGEKTSKERRRELEIRKLLPLTEDNPAVPRIARIIGYLIGDGTVYFSGNKGFVNAFGKKEDLEKIKEDVKALGFSAKIYTRVRKAKIKDQYGEKEFESNSSELHVPSRALADLFISLGMPTGIKTKTDFEVPNWIMKSKKWIKRLFLAGFFGAEMSSPKTLSKTAFYMATVSQNKKKGYVNSGRKFLLQISELLKEFDIEVREISLRKEHKDSYRLRLMIAGEKNLLKLWRKIGFEFNEKRRVLAEVSCSYILKKHGMKKKRAEIAEKVRDYKKKGFKLRELQDMFASDMANRRFIERSYYEGAEQRIPLSFESFESFKKRKIDEIETYGVLFDKIESIDFEKFEGEVYDFNVEETHNFIANGVVVSNCGVRLLTTPLKEEDVRPKIKELIDGLFTNVPSGVGSESKLRVSHEELDEAVTQGIDWAIKKGYGREEDKERTEEYGRIEGADPSKVTTTAKKRGRKQFGTLGAGNHFLEIQVVDKVFNPEVAKAFGLEEGMVTAMIHCGSRGFGHQICTDNIGKLLDLSRKLNLWLPDKELVYAPLNTQEAQDYLAAMRCAVNYAFINRHVIMHWTRETFDQVFGKGTGEKMKLVYDVAHNIAKMEEHDVDGVKKKLIVHRKGATRAFPAGRPELPEIYRSVGQPVLIPGSMGTASYVLVGNKKGLERCWGSTCHGAGRRMSRGQAIRTHDGKELTKQLWDQKKIYVRATNSKVIAEEAPDAYKAIDDVVQSVVDAGISDMVVRLRPLGVAKG